jgi:hypothetical protein
MGTDQKLTPASVRAEAIHSLLTDLEALISEYVGPDAQLDRLAAEAELITGCVARRLVTARAALAGTPVPAKPVRAG